MPQLDPVLIFFQSFFLISFYLIFYFFFFRSYIFPLFFFNFKFNYYYTLQIYSNIIKVIYFYSCQLFYLKYIILNWIKNLNYFYKNNLNFLFQIEICKNYRIIFTNFYENLWYWNFLKEKIINNNILKFPIDPKSKIDWDNNLWINNLKTKNKLLKNSLLNEKFIIN